jgi:hypothetical protein
MWSDFAFTDLPLEDLEDLEDLEGQAEALYIVHGLPKKKSQPLFNVV